MNRTGAFHLRPTRRRDSTPAPQNKIRTDTSALASQRSEFRKGAVELTGHGPEATVPVHFSCIAPPIEQ